MTQGATSKHDLAAQLERGDVYVDAVEVHLPLEGIEHYEGDLRALQKTPARSSQEAVRKSVYAHQATNRGVRRAVVDVKQPTRSALELLAQHRAEVIYLEVAIDIPATDQFTAERVIDLVLDHLDNPRIVQPKGREPSATKADRKRQLHAGNFYHGKDGTTYYAREALRASDRPEGRPTGTNIAAYADKPSRFTGEPCAHIERKARGVDDVERVFGVTSAAELLDLIDAGGLPEKLLASFHLATLDGPKLIAKLFPDEPEDKRRRRLLIATAVTTPHKLQPDLLPKPEPVLTVDQQDRQAHYWRSERPLSPAGARLLAARHHDQPLDFGAYLTSLEVDTSRIKTLLLPG